ncbi:unnamed protein product, partial [Laminaria digitata]
AAAAEGKPSASNNDWRPPPPPPPPLPPSAVLGPENFDIFLGAVAKLLPASLTLAAPHKPPPPPLPPPLANPGRRTRTGKRRGEGGRGRSGGVSGRSRSPYEEAECLGMVLQCLVEACTESLDSGAWTLSAGAQELVALGRLLRRCVLPVARCCSHALRALEGQLELSLAWRCSQTLTRKGLRDRGRGSNVPGGGTPEQDYGMARLCRGLLEQCDLCVDAVRGLCTAVRAATYSEGKGAAQQASPAGKPHRAALDRIVQILPGLALQSDQLSTAVDNARQALQLPRAPSGSRGHNSGSGSGGGGGRARGEVGASPSSPHRRQSPSKKPMRRTSARLLSRFSAGGGGRFCAQPEGGSGGG